MGRAKDAPWWRRRAIRRQTRAPRPGSHARARRGARTPIADPRFEPRPRIDRARLRDACRPVVAHIDALARSFTLNSSLTSTLRDPARLTPQLALPALALPAAWRAYGAGYLDKSEVTDRVVSVVKNFNKVDPAKVGPSSSFGADPGLDSLDTVEVVMAMEEEFAVEIPDAEADKITSVAEAVEYLAANPDAK